MAIANVKSYEGVEYMFASRQEGDKWNIYHKKFILSVGESIIGQYLTTMWFSCIVHDSTTYEFMVIQIDETMCMSYNDIERQINSTPNYLNIPIVFMYGRIKSDTIKYYKLKIQDIIDKNNHSIVSFPIDCDLLIGDKNKHNLNITIQGNFNKDNDDKKSISYILTLPMFTTKL